MELRHLRYFEAVAQTLHFGQAAERLHLSQPAVSKQIQELEAEVGVALFLRHKKSVQLTDAGQAFLEETRKTLAQAELAVQRARQVRAGTAGEVRVGYDSSMLQGLLTPVLHALQQQLPLVKVGLREGCNMSLSQALVDGQIDLALTFGSPSQPALSSRTLGHLDYVAVLPQGHRLASLTAVSLTELRQEPFIMCPRQENPALYDALLQACAEAGFTPRIVQESPSQVARIGLVGAGLGVTLAVESLRTQPFPGVVFRSLEQPVSRINLVACWKRSPAKPLVRVLLRLLPSA